MLKLLILLLAAFPCLTDLGAQEIRWVPGHEVADPDYVDGTNCKENVLCYALAYTPAESGVLTSYTTNFLVDCDGGNSAILSNSSLVMTNNSYEENACSEVGLLLMHNSGNTGAVKIGANREIYLHEICVQTSARQTTLKFVADEVGGITTSIDRRDRPAITERPYFHNLHVKRNLTACEGIPGNDFDLPERDLPAEFDEEFIGLQLRVTPNPVSDLLNVRFNHTAEIANLRLLDASGKELRSWIAPAGAIKPVDVSKLPAGMYYLHARTTGGGLTEKFVVQH